MTHRIFKIEAFALNHDYVIEVRFTDGTIQTIDFEPVLSGELYGPLRDPALFNRVRIDHEVHTLVWPNGADFDPETLHDWPHQAEAFRELAGSWTGSAQTESRDHR